MPSPSIEPSAKVPSNFPVKLEAIIENPSCGVAFVRTNAKANKVSEEHKTYRMHRVEYAEHGE